MGLHVLKWLDMSLYGLLLRLIKPSIMDVDLIEIFYNEEQHRTLLHTSSLDFIAS